MKRPQTKLAVRIGGETIAMGGSLLGCIYIVDARVDIVALIGCSIAAVALVRLGLLHFLNPTLLTPAPSHTIPQGNPFERFGRIRERLRWADQSAEYFDTAVRPMVVALIDDRLRRSLDIDRTRQPESAERALGPEMWAFVTGANMGHPPTIDDLGRIVAQIGKM